jgi:hypothetical protein
MLATAAQARTPKAFDLACDGVSYRIDLKRGMWCAEDCAEPSFFRYRKGDIVFLLAAEHFAIKYDMKRKVMSSGSSYPGEGPDTEQSEERRCIVKAFSGIPAPKAEAR